VKTPNRLKIRIKRKWVKVKKPPTFKESKLGWDG
jgi:hypothetical protein